jgi:hypothetical protein
MAQERRDLPNLRAYVQKRAMNDPIRRGVWKSGLGCVGLLGFAAVGTWASIEFLSWWFAMPALLFSMGLGAGIMTILDQAIRQPRDDAERHQVQLHGLFKAIAGMGGKRIQKEVDPVAAQILEACAIQRERVISSLSSPMWTSRGNNEMWRSVRDESLAAAESAMEEAVVLASPFIGPGRGREEDEWYKVVTDFLDKGVGAAIRRVDRLMAKRAPLDEASVPKALRPAFEVAMKLQALADEVESAAETAMTAPSSAGSSLDQALQNLKAVQEAEQELDAPTQVQQRLQ